MSHSNLIYILSDVRSGSTVLDLLLGKHPQIVSVGELQFLKEFFQNREKCTCGEPMPDCEFWKKIAERLQTQNFEIQDSTSLLDLPSGFWQKIWFNLNLHFGKRAAVENQINRPIIQYNWSVIDTIAEEMQVKYVLESSKIPERAKYYSLFAGERNIKFIFLIRDGRGVSFSKMRRNGYSAFRSAASWFLVNTNLILFRLSLPASQKLSIRYEDLCQKPNRELGKILRFLNLERPADLLHAPVLKAHNVGGSPHRFHQKENFQLREDRRWQTEMRQFDLLTVSTLTFVINFFSGYIFKRVNFW